MLRSDLKRELEKIYDVLEQVDRHFDFEAQMNAALHMSSTVRPAPLAAAVSTALGALNMLVNRLETEDVEK